MASNPLASVGRNAPCPCGSGKRYKECHGALSTSLADPLLAKADAPDRARRMSAALDAQRAWKLPEAQRLYQSVLEEEPGNFDALHMLGVITFELGRLPEAEAFVRRAIAIRPDSLAAHENLRLIVTRARRENSAAQLELEAEATRRARGEDPARGVYPSDVRIIAFYLPQYHPIPENDLWWGKGFTEWTNVRKAFPNFVGHEQPHEPGELSYYDLRSPDVRERQAALAREFGIHAFCYYVYWFNGKRLLEQPLDEVVASGRPDFPFCICWANENWTRRWDGLDHHVLIGQEYSPEDGRAFIRHYLPVLADRRYVRVDGRPLVLVYKLDLVPHARMLAEIWREEARRFGLGELYLCAARATSFSDPEAFGFDAAVEFPPHGFQAYRLNAQVGITNPEFKGPVFDYRDQVAQSLAAPPADHLVFRTVMPGWDNTARRQHDGTVFIQSSPALFEYWLHAVIEQTRRRLPVGKRLVFVNAWNEWGEGCHLEPDRRHGRGYLEAVRAALVSPTRDWPPVVPISCDVDQDAAFASCEADPTLTVRRFDPIGEIVRDGPLVSVVMPVHNHAQFLIETVSSVFAQTHRNLELIAVDDGSTDDSFSILVSLASRAPCRVIVVRQPNAGAPAARNRGLVLARGKYVALLDSDDAYAPNRVASLLRSMGREGAVFAFSGTEFVDRDGHPAEDHRLATELREKIDAIQSYPNSLYSLVLSNVAISTGNLMFERSLLAEIGGFRDLKLCHDWDFVLMATYAGRMVYVPEPLYRYRLHGTNASARMRLYGTEETEAVYRRFFARIDRHPWLATNEARECFLRFAHEHGCRGYFPVPATWRYQHYDEWVALYGTLDEGGRDALRRAIGALRVRPLLSILLPTFNSNERLLRRCLDSVLAQLYPQWELCVADDASTDAAVRSVLEEYAAQDPRIKVTYRAENGHICRATNSALEMATGEYVILLDHDDELAEEALYWVAKEIDDNPDARLIYSDEDKITESGVRFAPYFKPDWNPELLRAQDCVGHAGAMRAADLRAIGGFRIGFEGAQDWDVALRISEDCGPHEVRHIARVLYHWRATSGSTSLGMQRKTYARAAQQRALAEHLARVGRQGAMESVVRGLFWRVDYAIRRETSATLVIDGRGSTGSLRDTLSAVARALDPSIGAVRVLVDSAEGAHIASELAPAIAISFEVLRCDPGTTAGVARNMACQQGTEAVIVVLTAGIGALKSGWCERLIGYAQDETIGVVAPTLLLSDGTFHNAGILLDPELATVRAHLGREKGRWTPGARDALAQNLTVPGSEWLAFRRDVHAAIGGFDAMFRDGDLLAADFCLRARASGLWNVWTPYVEGVWLGRHFTGWEPRNRGEIEEFLSRWQRWVSHDPAYNPNLASGARTFELAFPPRHYPPEQMAEPPVVAQQTAVS